MYIIEGQLWNGDLFFFKTLLSRCCKPKLYYAVKKNVKLRNPSGDRKHMKKITQMKHILKRSHDIYFGVPKQSDSSSTHESSGIRFLLLKKLSPLVAAWRLFGRPGVEASFVWVGEAYDVECWESAQWQRGKNPHCIPIPSMYGIYLPIIYPHFAYVYGKCRKMYHPLSVWDIDIQPIPNLQKKTQALDGH